MRKTHGKSLEIETDVLVVGSGAGGLTAAVTARLLDLEVLVLEKEPVFGGSTAWSGGVAWVPGNSHEIAAGIQDSLELAREYIRHEAGNFFDPDRVEAFLVGGPKMIDFLEHHTAVKFELAEEADYHPSAPGALARGRA
ncbi:MAG: FAD-dependent oxidoreductase, partial [Terriglobales bacterium]